MSINSDSPEDSFSNTFGKTVVYNMWSAVK